MSDSKEGFEEEVIKGVEKNVSGYIDSKEHDDDIKKEFASDQKFKGASFVANFSIIKESVDETVSMQSKRERFQKTVEMALDRVKNDLVNTMTLKDPDTFVRKISDEEIDKFTQHGIKIVITGKVITEEERKEREEKDPFGFGEKK